MAEYATRRAFLAATGTAISAGCSSTPATDERNQITHVPSVTTFDEQRQDTPTSTTSEFDSPTPTSDSFPPVAEQSLPLPTSPLSLRRKIRSGGVPKDGIPSIDQPKFEPAAAVGDRLASNDIVFGLVRNGITKAYPQNILVQHEICNDTIGNEPISITYCPLTGTVLGFKRGETTFGVSGRLLNNNLTMYDRATQLWWPQVLATALPSPWHNEYTRYTLQDFRVIWTTWKKWRNLHPDTRVLTRDTGYVRNYDRDPYGDYDYPEKSGYYAPESRPMFPSLSEWNRYAPKRVVMGARTPQGAVAFLKDTLRERHIMDGTLAGSSVVAVYDPRLDTGYVYKNSDEKSFSVQNGRIIDEDGIAHAPDALPLSRIHTFDAMWFAWSGFYPGTSVYD